MAKITAPQLFTPLLTLVFLLLVSTMATLAIDSIEKESRQQIGSSLNAVLQTTVTTYRTWLEYRKRDALELAGSRQLIDMVNQLSRAEGAEKQQVMMALRHFMQPKLARENDQGFFIISPQRISIASMRDSNLNSVNLIHQQRPEYLDQAFDGQTLFIPTLVSDVPLNTSSSTNTLPISLDKKPLSIFVVSPITQHEKIVAVLAIRINLSEFFTSVTELSRLGNSGETYAFDKSGLLITGSRFDHQLRRLGLIAPGEKGIMNLRIADPGGDMLAGYKPQLPIAQRPLTTMARSAIRGQSGNNVEGYRDYRGVEVFGAWVWNAALGFGIATELDVNEALHPFYQTRRIIIIVLILTLMMALSLLTYVTQIQRIQKRELRQAYNSLEQRVKLRTKELVGAKKSLEVANAELEVLAVTDGLTSLNNRRSFDTHLENEWLRCRREHKSLGVIIFDIDFFKYYNDHYGHQKGDQCLQKIAQALHQIHNIRRPGDLIARYGGEEFVIVLSAPTPNFIKQVANQVLQQIRQLAIPHEASPLTEQIVTVSVGYAIESDLDSITSSELISRADKALYKAKSQGRNQVLANKPAQPLL